MRTPFCGPPQVGAAPSVGPSDARVNRCLDHELDEHIGFEITLHEHSAGDDEEEDDATPQLA